MAAMTGRNINLDTVYDILVIIVELSSVVPWSLKGVNVISFYLFLGPDLRLATPFSFYFKFIRRYVVLVLSGIFNDSNFHVFQSATIPLLSCNFTWLSLPQLTKTKSYEITCTT